MDTVFSRRALPALFAALLLATAWPAIAFTREGTPFAAVWPVNAIWLAFLLRWPHTRLQQVLVVAGAVPILLAANALAGVSAGVAIVLTATNLFEVGVTWLILRRCQDPTAGLKPVLAFLGGAILLAPALGGLTAAMMMRLVGEPVAFVPMALRWFVSHGLGTGLVATFLLTVGRHSTTRFDGAAKLRFLGAQAAVTAASLYIFLGSNQPPLFMIAPFLVVAAMSHSQFGGATALAIVTGIALAGAHFGRGSAAVAELIGIDSSPLTRLFLASLIFTVLPVSALLRRLESYAIELEERRAKAEELNAIKTRLLAHVSHEIRSPMAGVTTLAELLRDGALGELTPSQRESLDQIVASGVQVTDLARDLTDAAALQSGKATIELAAVVVRQAVASALEMAKARAAQYGCEVEVVRGDADDLPVRADPLRLRQILVNLIVNGAKYGGRPSRVRIRTHLTRAGAVRFEVSDNGPGISLDQREGLFKDFERLGAEKVDLDGAGLGLALSYQIARLQGGGLGVEDGELGGACFWLELPLARDVAAAA